MNCFLGFVLVRLVVWVLCRGWWTLCPGELCFRFQTSAERGLQQDVVTARMGQCGLNKVDKSLPDMQELRRRVETLRSCLLTTFFCSSAAALVGAIRRMGKVLPLPDPALLSSLGLSLGSLFLFRRVHKLSCDVSRALGCIMGYDHSSAVRVVRDGSVKEVEASLLVPGDMIIVSRGHVSADCRILSAEGLVVEPVSGTSFTASTARGEEDSEPRVSDCAVLAHSEVVGGRGLAMVTRTGENVNVIRVLSRLNKLSMLELTLIDVT
ncbi:hypothetical protein GUITHDRAFT_110385 [Guillardia theta CCMP2712]|uniref:P-type ATPase A domain-containing protein n=1 Tax=Guillardia theta (strain CCMP2712) TaxID=905079 RepID=L1J657_GUITC|nr:hypothetical protein GUITHDRAFT_110385 [Guillardia theta CCMP2712]EKX43580.1 hypothetical protein GUITHDRAFT_110385 [Guillardia theta CCMP2712]|eukprot:XP_005830560.1 hypothetical protein GUITHDRAFT_110385 [Guillardia theta CCMP2712]